MSSEEISLNGLNSQLVFQDDPLRSFSCHQHHHHHRGVGGGGGGDPGPKTRELTGFIDDKIFSSVDRDRYFRPQSTIFADHHPDRHRDHPQQQQHQEPRDWNNGHPATATTPSTDESDGDDDDVDDEDDDDEDEVENNNKNTNNINNLNSNSNSANCNNNNNSTNCSVVIPVGNKMGNGKAKQLSNSFGKNGNVMQTVNINNGALVTVAEADGDMYYSQYMQGTTEGSSGSGQKECVAVDNGFGISGSGGDSLRAILSDPVTGTLMDDAMILPCGHTFGAAGIQHISRTKACFTCSRPVSEDSIAPNLSLRAAVQAFRREEELQYYRSCKRRRERFDQDKGSFGDSTLNDLPRGRGVQFPFAVTDRVIIKGNKRTPQRFVGREAVVTTQCLNGWFVVFYYFYFLVFNQVYVVKTLDNAESVKLQYRSLAKVPDDPSSKPTVTKMPSNWL